MSQLTNLVKSSFTVALENIPVAGKIFQVIREMNEQKNWQKLQKQTIDNNQNLKKVLETINNIEKGVESVNKTIRNLKQYDANHDFVMLPKLLYEERAFQDFWLHPQEYGGIKEPLATAQKKPNYFSFIMADMLGEFSVYHIPIQIFGLLLQNQALQGKSCPKAFGIDPISQTQWVTQNENVVLPKNTPPSFNSYEESIAVASTNYDESEPIFNPYIGKQERKMASRLIAITKEFSGRNDVNEYTSLSEYGLDDLDFVEILMEAEEECDCTFDIDPTSPLPTICDILKTQM
ncbi:acyl carrier protein [Candidatus Uabimicrobium amorphum]|uniref:Carrier domain-containing protein n=1 Tax=Uabimicrobium amorphum TaxID=2596890 RepID=A0A5S9IS97_UABAM|nr:acyl carrier protein [Candidatus Uabimicrobium amorphum]BBM86984.1 hypothetical protein UABAM_05386 [Candidatus Uabimicrobium amorphum]